MLSRNRKSLLLTIAFLPVIIVIIIFFNYGCKATSQDAKPSGGDIVCVVNADHELGVVERGLFGTNSEWFNNGGGLVSNQGVLDTTLIHLAKKQGISLVRFPGGTLSDFYHWQDGIGPRGSRPVRPHYTDPSSSANVLGTPELIKFCQAVGAQPLITVNAGTGTASEAAGWVDYLNGATNARRISDGLPQPLNVKLWEVGNELYLNGSDAEKKITLPPDVYAERFLSYASAMRAVDPSISLMAIGIAGSYNVPFGPYPDWNKTVLAKAASEIDYIAVHNAYFPVIMNEKSPVARDVYQAVWAAPEAVNRDLTELSRLISQHEKGRTINIAVTEWGPLYAILDPVWFDHVKTLGSAVYVARMIQVLMSHPRVKVANYFKFTDQTFMGWVSAEHQPKVPYFVIELFAKHFGSRLIATSINSPLYSSRKMGMANAEKNIPQLTAVASLNQNKDKLFVNIVNRAWDKTHKVAFQTKGFAVNANALVWEISGPDVKAHNGNDSPSWWPVVSTDPPPKPAGQATVGIMKKQHNLAVPLTILPHSIVTVEITRQKKWKGKYYEQ